MPRLWWGTPRSRKQLAKATFDFFLALILVAAASDASSVDVVRSIAAFASFNQRKEHVASARFFSSSSSAAAVLAADWSSKSCCSFPRGWEFLRQNCGGARGDAVQIVGARILVIEGSIGKFGGRSAAHAKRAHCQILLLGAEPGVIYIFEPFANDWKRKGDIIPVSVGKFISSKTKALTVKLICGGLVEDGFCRAHCARFVASLAADQTKALQGATVLAK